VKLKKHQWRNGEPYFGWFQRKKGELPYLRSMQGDHNRSWVRWALRRFQREIFSLLRKLFETNYADVWFLSKEAFTDRFRLWNFQGNLSSKMRPRIFKKKMREIEELWRVSCRFSEQFRTRQKWIAEDLVGEKRSRLRKTRVVVDQDIVHTK